MTSIGIKLVAATEPVAASRKLRLGSLTALVIGSMIGSGVFSLPQNMAAGAGPLAIAIGWGITAIPGHPQTKPERRSLCLCKSWIRSLYRLQQRVGLLAERMDR
jgi:hypothetical protein